MSTKAKAAIIDFMNIFEKYENYRLIGNFYKILLLYHIQALLFHLDKIIFTTSHFYAFLK